jgi:hypothetical protein
VYLTFTFQSVVPANDQPCTISALGLECSSYSDSGEVQVFCDKEKQQSVGRNKNHKSTVQMTNATSSKKAHTKIFVNKNTKSTSKMGKTGGGIKPSELQKSTTSQSISNQMNKWRTVKQKSNMSVTKRTETKNNAQKSSQAKCRGKKIISNDICEQQGGSENDGPKFAGENNNTSQDLDFQAAVLEMELMNQSLAQKVRKKKKKVSVLKDIAKKDIETAECERDMARQRTNETLQFILNPPKKYMYDVTEKKKLALGKRMSGHPVDMIEPLPAQLADCGVSV